MLAAAAHAYCREVTRHEARNFYYGIRLLPPDKRDAMSAIYALARRIDDIGDADPCDNSDRLAELTQVRAKLAGDSTDPVLVALTESARRFPIPMEAFADLIDGVEMDLRATTYDSIDDLVLYCRRVAGSIGRLSVAVFGVPVADPVRAVELADRLGIALQLTNILRDLREDTANGRRYLPAKDLAEFGCELRLDQGGRLAGAPDRMARLIRFEAARAEGWFAEGLRLLPMLDRRSAACCAAMAGIYRRLLQRISHQPERVLTSRVALSGWEKAGVAGRALLRGGR